jgi:shikimate kinase/3-dehydroquinate synthase
VAPLLALAGYMGSGKSSVGEVVARRLAWDFVDLDSRVESRLGRAISDYFTSAGETEFRIQEAQVLADVLESSTSTGTVVALGGGTLMTAESRRKLNEAGTIVLLDVDPAEAWRRVEGSGRPLAQDRGAFLQLWVERRGTYEAAADWIVSTSGKDVDRISAELVDLVKDTGEDLRALWSRQLGRTERSSQIVGGVGALALLKARACEAHDQGRRLHVISDANVAQALGQTVPPLLGEAVAVAMYVMEPGEASKSIAVLERCWEWLGKRNTRRDDIVVALGGGVVGDVAGFVAATYHRGIGLWQIPTSLLAQVDSSVGGKTAINLSVAKNLVGAFYQADLAVIDPNALATLPQGEYTGALGEVIKHALLASKDDIAALEGALAGIVGRDTKVLSALVRRSVWFKASVVESDEREAGRRAILNLGHTTAHALESALGYGTVNHGQAVALGVLAALAVSEELLGLDARVRERTAGLMAEVGLSTSMELPGAESLLAAMGRDKKVRPGTSGFVGLRAVGEPVWGLDVPPDTLARALEVIRR